jgi:hypothetical protein
VNDADPVITDGVGVRGWWSDGEAWVSRNDLMTMLEQWAADARENDQPEIATAYLYAREAVRMVHPDHPPFDIPGYTE